MPKGALEDAYLERGLYPFPHGSGHGGGEVPLQRHRIARRREEDEHPKPGFGEAKQMADAVFRREGAAFQKGGEPAGRIGYGCGHAVGRQGQKGESAGEIIA